jgi:hypothetical protein
MTCISALTLFLQQSTATDKGGGGLGSDFVDRISDRGTLFTLAKMLVNHYQLAFVLDAQYGLTNRLRAYGSARAIAAGSARFLVVLWDLDSHCQADLRRLFQVPVDVHVLTDVEPVRELLRKTYVAGLFTEIDLMVPEQKNSLVDAHSDKHLYVSSAFQIRSKDGYGEANVVQLRYVFAELWLGFGNLVSALPFWTAHRSLSRD